jgi:hypothetical protein
MQKYLPIRKVVMTAIGGGLAWAAMRSGLDLGDDSLNQAATVLTGLVFAYVEKDPRVVSLLDSAVTLEAKVGHTFCPCTPAEAPAAPVAPVGPEA